MIVSHPRSGSNFLRDALNSHPDAFECGEAFHLNPMVSIYPSKLLGKDQLAIEDLDPMLEKLALERQVEAIGFTLFSQEKWHLLDYQVAATLATRPDIYTFVLVRRNLLKAFVSLKRAALTGLWHVDAAGRIVTWEHAPSNPEAKTLTIGPIDIEEARAWIEETRAFLDHIEAALNASGKNYHKLYYEDLCMEGKARSLEELNRALKFLGLRKLKRYESQFGRTADKGFYDSIPNRQELVSEIGFDLD